MCEIIGTAPYPVPMRCVEISEAWRYIYIYIYIRHGQCGGVVCQWLTRLRLRINGGFAFDCGLTRVNFGNTYAQALVCNFFCSLEASRRQPFLYKNGE